ncbi:glycosyltransferase [Lunatibacter salilacus]|uniref:glycosyltransferase n=1 Tax=Lunatibacter salilacus TaxID=2483804 RepID=UPI00131EB6F1|nr:glycosyltransferase [Lunatibacter salilacus]
MKNYPKIAHLTSVHSRYDNRILIKQCVSLKNAGYDVNLIVADGKGPQEFEGVTIVDVGANKGLLHRMVFQARAVYKAAKKLNPDVYQIHDPELLPYAYILAKQGKKVIYDIHEDYVTGIGQKEYLPRWVKGVAAKMLDKLEKIFSKNTTLLLAEKYYQERFPEGTLILNYPIVSEKAAGNLAKVHSGFKGKDLIYTGNLTEVRGAYTQTRLLNHIPDIHISFIGFCKMDLARELEKSIGENVDRMRLIGKGEFVPFDQITTKYLERKWVAGLAIFPKTKHYEKKELTKFFEYMTYGLPIICSDFPVWKALVEENQCGIAVDPDNFAEIEKAITTLYEDQTVYEQMCKNGRNAVLNKYNWEVQESKLLQVYSRLLS